jgi:hypothetical protein
MFNLNIFLFNYLLTKLKFTEAVKQVNLKKIHSPYFRVYELGNLFSAPPNNESNQFQKG